MYSWIVENGFYPVIIATKADKIKRSQLAKHMKMLRLGLNVAEGTPMVPFSALTKQGRDEIWELIETYALDQGPETDEAAAAEDGESRAPADAADDGHA